MCFEFFGEKCVWELFQQEFVGPFAVARIVHAFGDGFREKPCLTTLGTGFHGAIHAFDFGTTRLVVRFGANGAFSGSGSVHHCVVYWMVDVCGVQIQFYKNGLQLEHFIPSNSAEVYRSTIAPGATVGDLRPGANTLNILYKNICIGAQHSIFYFTCGGFPRRGNHDRKGGFTGTVGSNT